MQTARSIAVRIGLSAALLGIAVFGILISGPTASWSIIASLTEEGIVIIGAILLLGGLFTIMIGVRREWNRRDRIEARLRRSERHLIDAVAALEKRVAVLDAAGRVLASTRVIGPEGLDKDTPLIQNESAGTGPNDRVGLAYVPELDELRDDPTPQARAIWSGIHAVIEGEQREYQLEYPIQGEGETRWHLMRVTRIEDDEGPVRVALVDEDITGRVLAGRELRESEEHLQSLVTSIDDLVFALDPDQRFLSAHGQWLRHTGHDSRDLTGLSPRVILGDAAATALATVGPRVLAGEHLLHEIPVSLERTTRHLQASLSPLREADGSVRGIVGVGRDVTERTRVERELRRRDAIMETIGFASSHLLRSTDWGASIRDVLEHLAAATGVARVSLSELVNDTDGRPILRLMQEWATPEVAGSAIFGTDGQLSLERKGLRRWEERLAGSRPVVIRRRWLPAADRAEFKKHGIESITLLPVFVGKKLAGVLSFESRIERVWSTSELGALGIAADVFAAALDRMRIEDALQESEAQLQQAQKMEAVGRLAGGVAHDFNNLLTAIKGRTELLLNEEGVVDQFESDLAEIRAAAIRAATLTRQLLAFSRRQILQPKVLDLNQIIRGIEMMLRRLIGEDIILITRLASDLGAIQADPGHIEQVLMNLLVNARDAMPEGGTVTIETANLDLDQRAARLEGLAEGGSYVLFQVTDTGSGIPGELHERIFEPFFTTKEQGKGTGLGLSMIWGIVKQSGGHISIRSEIGEGTTFRILLPRNRSPIPVPAPAEPRPTPATGSETILLVEDEAAVRSLVRKVLERRGYTVHEATNGAEAIQIVQALPAPIDLLLTDVVMPDIGGPALVDILAPQIDGLRVLFMSGYTDQEIIRRGVDQFHAGFIGKPFSPDELSAKVREILDADLPTE